MSPYPVPATASQSKRLVLFLAANPTNTQPLRLDEEVRAIRQQLQRSVLTLDSCWAVRPSDMQQEILRLKPQIVHFSGHGIGEPPSIDSGNRTLSPVGKNYLHDEEGLAFIRDATGQAALVGAEALANLFKHFKDYVEYVVLNGCYSEVQAKAIARHIPYVIGMKESLLDRAAIEFSKGFYNALAEGEAIESAFELGKTAIELAGMRDFQFPVLHKPDYINVSQSLAALGSGQFKPAKLKPKRWIIVGGILASLVGSAVVGISPKLQRDLGMRQATCSEQAKQEGKKLGVAIANFQRDASNQNTTSTIEASIRDLLERKQPSVSLCTTNESAQTEGEARKLGNKLEAAIVIWGTQPNPSMLAVGVTTVQMKVGDLTSLPSPLIAKDEQDFSNQLKDLPALVNIMTAYALSEINKDDPNVRTAFEKTLKFARDRELDLTNENNKQILSKAYFWLGLSYLSSPTDCTKDKGSCLKAIDSYKSATQISPSEKFLEAYRLRASLETSLEKFSAAIQTHTELINIDPDSESALEARGYRAHLFIRQKDFKRAAIDFQILCEKNPNDYELLHELGKAQLLAGEPIKAQNTYHQVKKLLKTDKSAIPKIITDLELLAQEHLELRSNIRLIIVSLR